MHEGINGGKRSEGRGCVGVRGVKKVIVWAKKGNGRNCRCKEIRRKGLWGLKRVMETIVFVKRGDGK